VLENRCKQGVVRKLEGKYPLGKPRLDVRIILKWTLKEKENGRGLQ
jgi:hypothetical protein